MAGTEPLFTLRSYGGASQANDLLAPMGTNDTSFVLANPPVTWVESHGANIGSVLGTSGNFTVVIDPELPTEEKIRCSSISGSVVSVAQTGAGPTLWTGRGYDGTSPQVHNPPTNPSGLVFPVFTSSDAYESNLLVNEILGNLGPAGTVLQSTGSGLAYVALSTLTPIAQTGSYTAIPNDFVEMSGGFTVTLPTPVTRRTVGVVSTNGSGTAPAIVATPTGSISGPGIKAGVLTIDLGAPGAFVVLLADGAKWNVVAGRQDTGWVKLQSSGLNTGVSLGHPTPAVRLMGNEVWWQGQIILAGSYSAGEEMFTMGASVQPSTPVDLVADTYGLGPTRLTVDTGISLPNWVSSIPGVSLDGIRYLVD